MLQSAQHMPIHLDNLSTDLACIWDIFAVIAFIARMSTGMYILLGNLTAQYAPSSSMIMKI